MPKLAPLAHPDLIGPSTEEQRALALQHTERSLVEVRDLLRKLDLPVSAFEVAVDIYHSNLAGVMLTENMAKADRRERKIAMIRHVRGQQSAPLSASGTARVRPLYPMLGDCGVYDALDNATDEELDEIVRAHDIKI